MRWKDDIMKWQGATWTRTAKDRKKWKELKLRRATSSSGGTQPMYKVQGTRYKVTVESYIVINFTVTNRIVLMRW